VLGVLIEILRCDAVTTRCRFPRKRDVSLEDLMGVTADFDVRAIAAKGFPALWSSVLALEWPVPLVAAPRALVRSCSHVIRWDWFGTRNSSGYRRGLCPSSGYDSKDVQSSRPVAIRKSSSAEGHRF
jgi:hypothetical protein